MITDQPWHFYLMAILYITAGLFHFMRPIMYLRIMPPYVPKPKLMVLLSGLAEVALGTALFFSMTKDLALWGIMALLVAFLPVHLHMLKGGKAGAGLPQWLLVIRLPLQFLLVYWAFGYLA